MGMASLFTESTVANYVRTIRETPREIVSNRRLILTAIVYALAAIPLTWDQGSSSVVPSLPGFQADFGLTSGANPAQITNFVSFVYIGAGIGSAISFFINDRFGRLWSFRIYSIVWIIGQMMATGSSGSLEALYAARVVSGLGIGALTVLGPISLVEVAPKEIRGLITVWFSVAALLGLFVAVLCVYGVYLHIPDGPLQYQTVFFAPTIWQALVCVVSFFAVESPRWLLLVGRNDEAVRNLVALRGLPANHPRVASELDDIHRQIQKEQTEHGNGVRSTSWTGIKSIFHETFMVKANLRRAQQAMIAYSLAQLSGANSITSYFVPILALTGQEPGEAHSLFLTGMYSLAKFFFTILASFFFIDALGRRNSLFCGCTIQMISDIYVGVFIKYNQEGPVTNAASQGAIAMLFIHGFGFAIGLLVLPYVFTGEVWPNQIRSFGAALTQTWHWLFYFGVNRGMPSLLENTNNWGAFLFFAGWCFVAIIYTFFVVPETSGMSLEDIDKVFEGPFFKAYRTSKRIQQEEKDLSYLENGHSKLSTNYVEEKEFSPARDGKM